MFTQESTYLYTLTVALVVAVAATLLLLGWALHRTQIFW
jgi:hypothetical protein